MTNLAKQLAKYYIRKKHKVIFLNNMSLQSFALEMYEKIGYEQIDASVISRVLKGERLFQVKQLEVFCTILRLPQEEKRRLFVALQKDYLTQKGFSRVYLEEFYSQQKLSEKILPMKM